MSSPVSWNRLMAEATLDLRSLPKSDAYDQLDEELRTVLAGVRDPIAAMATMSALIHHAFGHLWTGSTASSNQTNSYDVQSFPGHIACDARSRSEIVVPVFGRRGELAAVLDVDVAVLGAFDADDQRGLKGIISWFPEMES
jgi:L-methionine (R)-S-oxide reductase